MANKEQLAILKHGVEAWNRWRNDNADEEIDFEKAYLVAANLEDANLRGGNFNGADLKLANLRNADLRGANLNKADLKLARFENTNLREANFNEADIRFTVLENVKLYGANLIKANLLQANLSGAELTEANLSRAMLESAKFFGSKLDGSKLIGAYLKNANLKGADLREANLREADLRGAVLWEVNLRGADLRGADLRGADLTGADLSESNLENSNFNPLIHSTIAIQNTNLLQVQLYKANVNSATFNNANLTGANLSEANLTRADFTDASLREANLKAAMLVEANLTRANLYGSNLTGAYLTQSNFVQTNIERANISMSYIYGVNVWDIKGEFEEQKDLIITPDKTSIITVDNIEIAQFIYLLLNNKKIREILNTLTSKTVLILGRFAIPERKAILDALRNKLREYDLLPIVFDFDRPVDKDFTETIKTLAGISYFVIADVTNPKSSPLELQATVPDYQIPFVPIIQEGESPFAMMVDLQKKYNWVLDTISYDSIDTLIELLKPHIIDPAIKKHDELRLIKARVPTVISGKELIKKKGKRKSSRK